MRKDISLAGYTTFRIGGPADFFYEAHSADDLEKAVSAAREEGIPYFMLGGGSNVLFSDEGFRGLVVKLVDSRFEIRDLEITASAGVSLSELAGACASAGLSGLEWAAGIPGTLGGAIRGNAGAYGGCMADCVEKVDVLRGGNRLEITDYRQTSGYRHSIFKENDDIITGAILRLERGDSGRIEKKMKENLSRRNASLPVSIPSAGCFFKNPELSEKEFGKFVGRFPGAEAFSAARKIPAAWLIDRCGLKGESIGKAEISRKHANFIVNDGGATAKEVLELAGIAKDKVREKYGLELEEEAQLIGF